MCSIRCLKKKAELWSWLQNGAVFMFVEMLTWLRMSISTTTVAQDEGSMNEEEVAIWIKGLQRKTLS